MDLAGPGGLTSSPMRVDHSTQKESFSIGVRQGVADPMPSVLMAGSAVSGTC